MMANTKQSTMSIVLRALAGEKITAYSIAVIINERLSENGILKDGQLVQIRPQMMYSYDRNGLIVKGKKSVCHYELDEVHAFVNKYLKKYGIGWILEQAADEPESTECEGQLALI